MHRLRIVLVAVIAAVTGLLVLPGRASATPFPETWLADSALHTYCFTAGFSGGTDPSVGTYAMSVLDSTTDMTDSDAGACTSSSTDVWWWQQNLPGTIRGQAECIVWSGAVCDSADVRIDFAQIDIGGDDWYDRRKTAVHEIGHTIGLGHHNDCAMISGEVPSTALQWRRYSAHDVNHINAQY